MAGIRPRRHYDKEAEQKQYKQLLELYGKNKILPNGFELAALLALENYPELKDVRIEFVFETSDHPLSARPSVGSVLLPAQERTYLVAISTEIRKGMEPVLMRNLTFNMQIGNIAHEIGHVADFLQMSSLEVLEIGVTYFLPEYKRELEKKTDSIAVCHGFGFQLLEFAEYISRLEKEYPEEEYYKTYSKYYLSAGEIRQQMRQLELYKGMEVG